MFDKDEKVFLVLRQHWIIPGMKFFFWGAFIILIMLTENLIRANIPYFATGRPLLALEIVRSMLLLLGLLGLLIVWTLYYLNVQVITNERIIDVSQKSLLHNDTSELHLDRCQDVTTEVQGFLGNLFDYGNVRVQTAGEQENFIFSYIPHPQSVAKTVLELYEKVREQGGEKKPINNS